MRVAIWKSWAALRSLRRLSPSSGALFSSRTESPPQHLARRLDGLNQPTVWHEFSPLAAEYEAINLGQGFPDWQPPPFVQQAMVEAVTQSGANQYARSAAHLPLAQVLVEDYQTRWKMSEPMDPLTQVATTVGCTNALYCAMQGLVNPGDEVILLEPAFDIYDAAVRMAGGTSVFVPLRPIIEATSSPDTSNATTTTTTSASQVFTLDMEELAAAITDQTKVLLLNSPHNPTGKIFSRPELEQIAAVVRQYPQITILSDEVYEHIVFDPVHEPHVSMATVLWDQTLTLSSAGKTFSCTGWKVGWAVGPAHLVQAVTSVQQWTTFSVPTPNQEAIASVLRQARKPYVDEASGEHYDTYYDYVAALYKGKRKLLQEALEAAGLGVVLPPGGFFIMADTSAWGEDLPPSHVYQQITAATPTQPMPRDWALSRWLTQEVGVTAIPPSAFYSTPNVPLARNFLRFAFCKQDETLREAHRRLEGYFGQPEE
jgi:kynurenine--oxoglutarate transaminase/cysteine-S-conjugate beta-lyase/glutamine--phenylpyruvate transaminase